MDLHSNSLLSILLNMQLCPCSNIYRQRNEGTLFLQDLWLQPIQLRVSTEVPFHILIPRKTQTEGSPNTCGQWTGSARSTLRDKGLLGGLASCTDTGPHKHPLHLFGGEGSVSIPLSVFFALSSSLATPLNGGATTSCKSLASYLH